MTLPMLFCKIELKVYIPDGLGDFMEALSDPKAFLQAQEEKRAAQLKTFDIEDDDYDTTNLVSNGGGSRKKQPLSANKKQQPVIPGVAMKKTEEKGKVTTFSASEQPLSVISSLNTEEIKFESITPEVVKKEKSFVKLSKKHQKELETLRKKQQKERTMVQKTQCAAIEKLVKCKGK